MRATACSCIQPVRSVRCAHCAACLCSNATALEKFLHDAPPELRLRLRTAPESTARDTDQSATEQRATDRPTVLFADDDPTGRAIATRVIESLGYAVIVASNGEEALQAARDHRPSLIITDALMPRLDGREMGRIVKSELPGTKVVVITSVYKDPRYKHEALRNFAVDEYMPKPINPAALRALVTKHLGDRSG
jgi:CheY-like chemotaxis protein